MKLSRKSTSNMMDPIHLYDRAENGRKVKVSCAPCTDKLCMQNATIYMVRPSFLTLCTYQCQAPPTPGQAELGFAIGE